MTLVSIRSLLLVLFAVAIVQSPCALASESNKEILASIFDDIQAACSHKHQANVCFALVQKLQVDPDYQDPAIQFGIAFSLVSVYRKYPAVLDTAYKILSKLVQTYPENRDYLAERAFVRYYQDPIAGFCEAKEIDDPVTLSLLLKFYLESGSIQRDIKAFMVDGAMRSLARGDSMKTFLTPVRLALESSAKYGDEKEVAKFVSDVRARIPWKTWRQDEWGKTATTPDFDPKLAWDMLVTYCGSVMLTLDDGVFCADTAVLINKRATKTLLNDAKIEHALQWATANIKNQQPPKIGNALQILQQLAGAGQ